MGIGQKVGGFVKAIPSATWKVSKGTVILGAVVAGVAAVGVMASNAVSRTNEKRRYHPSEHLNDPMGVPSSTPQANTMMGLPPTPGPMAQRELARRNGLNGIDPSMPSPDVDGRPVQDLGAIR